MKRIAAGFYETVINGYRIEITRTQLIKGGFVWYAVVYDENERILAEGEDFHQTKKAALEAATYMANNPKEYDFPPRVGSQRSPFGIDS